MSLVTVETVFLGLEFGHMRITRSLLSAYTGWHKYNLHREARASFFRQKIEPYQQVYKYMSHSSGKGNLSIMRRKGDFLLLEFSKWTIF